MEKESGPHARTPKIRQSCDTCMASKIRCGQERPACRRCVKHNINCVYSMSRRAGRPRPRKTNPRRPNESASSQPSQRQPPPTSNPPASNSPSSNPPASNPPASNPPAPNSPSSNPATSNRATSNPATSNPATSNPTTSNPATSSPPTSNSSTTNSPSALPALPLPAYHDIYATPSLSCIASPLPWTFASTTQSPSKEQDITDQQNDFFQSDVPQQSHHLELFPSATMDLSAEPFTLFPSTTVDFGTAPSTILPLSDSSNSILHRDSSGLEFDFMFTPMPNYDDFSGPLIPYFDGFCGYSESLASSLTTTTSNENEDLMQDLIPSAACLCSTMLLRQLAESPAPDRNAHEDGEVGDSISSVQRSKHLLDHCFRVLHCARCGPKMSSALMLCQAMDEISIALGMGTLWADGSFEGVSLSSNLMRDEVPLRCGSYSVKGIDRRILMRALMKKRVTEMQQAMSRLYQIVLPDGAVSSTCQELCAGMVSELKGKVLSRAGSF